MEAIPVFVILCYIVAVQSTAKICVKICAARARAVSSCNLWLLLLYGVLDDDRVIDLRRPHYDHLL